MATLIRGTTWSTKVSGTSQTPLRTRTGASRTIGAPSTRMRAQFRVKVITWVLVRSRAWVASAGASSWLLRRSATRLSST